MFSGKAMQGIHGWCKFFEHRHPELKKGDEGIAD
jgi:hypothetical protein